MKVLTLVVLTLSAALVAVPVAGWLLGTDTPWRPAFVGLGVCLIPAIITLAFTERMARVSAQLAASSALMGSGMRMMWAVVAVFLLGERVAALGMSGGQLTGWVVTFYLITLAAESGLLMRSASRRGKAAGEGVR